MAIGDNIQRMREEFESQFEPAGGNRYLYRRNQKGEPIPVSPEERRRFIDTYARRVRYLLGATVILVMAFIGAAIAWEMSSGIELPEWTILTGALTVTAISIVAMYWARGAPARELRGRASIGRERTGEEMRVIYFKKISYGQLAIAAVVGTVLVASRASDGESSSTSHWIWLVAGTGLVILAVAQALRKWIFESQNL